LRRHLSFALGLITDAFLTALFLIPQTNRAAQQPLQQPPQPQTGNTITLLYDQKALEGLKTAGGLKMVFWKSGDKVISLGQPRWIIPAKVQPLVSGDSKGAEFYFFDESTGIKTGPFMPATQ
jgi:hypothetical protein